MAERGDDEEFEVLDVAEGGAVKRLLKDLTKAPVAKQVGVGAAAGWCSGYLFGKVGKMAAATLGGSLLLLQIAHHQGYITINIGKMQRDTQRVQKMWKQKADRVVPAITDEVKDFVIENCYLAGGFTAGFFIGLAS